MFREDIIETLDKYEKTAAAQQDKIKQLKLLVKGGLDTGSTVEKICRDNELLYLHMKSICYQLQGKEPANPVDEFGTTDAFDASIENMGSNAWKLTLPPFYSISAKRRFSNEGKHAYFLILRLLQTYEIENEKIEYMEWPVVFFRHHICTDIDRVFDFDNIDSKRAIDAMQGYFLKGDDALYLTVIHEAVRDEERSYCELFVTDRAKTDMNTGGIVIKKQAPTGKKR